MRLTEQNHNADLAQGFTSDPERKEGRAITIVARFDGLAADARAKLQTSVDAQTWTDIEPSATTIAAGQSEQAWTETLLPMGSYLRLVVEPGAQGAIETIKTLTA